MVATPAILASCALYRATYAVSLISTVQHYMVPVKLSRPATLDHIKVATYFML